MNLMKFLILTLTFSFLMPAFSIASEKKASPVNTELIESILNNLVGRIHFNINFPEESYPDYPQSRIYGCSAVMIGPRFAMTAAHCLDFLQVAGFRGVNPAVVLGNGKISKIVAVGTAFDLRTFPVSTLFHPPIIPAGFNDPFLNSQDPFVRFHSDVAFLLLEDEIGYTDSGKAPNQELPAGFQAQEWDKFVACFPHDQVGIHIRQLGSTKYLTGTTSLGTEGFALQTDRPTTRGCSGGGIFEVFIDGNLKIAPIGITAGFFRNTDSYESFVHVYSLYEMVTQRILDQLFKQYIVDMQQQPEGLFFSRQ